MSQPIATTAVVTFITAMNIIITVSALVPNPAASVELVKARLLEVILEHDLKEIAAEHHLVDLKISGMLSVLEGLMPHRTWHTKVQN